MTEAATRIRTWPRFALVQALQLPGIAMIAFLPLGWGWVAGGVWASLVAAAGTDSCWRWLNRILVAETVVWLTLAACAIR